MKLTLNLASRAYVDRRALKLFYAVVIGLLVLLLAFNLARSRQLQLHAGQIEGYLAATEQKLAGSREESGPEIPASEMLRQRQEVAFANEIISRDSFRWTRLLDQLEEMVPDGVALLSLEPDYKDSSLRISGQALGMRELRDLLDNLAAAPAISEVYLLDQSAIKENAGAGERRPIAFSILLKGVF